MYEIGTSPFFIAITAGMVDRSPEDADATTRPPVTMLPRQPDEPREVDLSTVETQMTGATEAVTGKEDNENFATVSPTEPSYTEPKTKTVSTVEPFSKEPDQEAEQEYPQSETTTPTSTSTERVQQTYPDPTEAGDLDQPEPTHPETTTSAYTVPEPSEPRYFPYEPRNPDTSTEVPRYSNPEPVQPVPPHSRTHHPQVVVVDEDDLNVNGKSRTR